MPLPIEIVGLRQPTVQLLWEDGHRTVFPARVLRLGCRCAFCVEETSGRALLDPNQVAADVIATHIELVGQYAMGVHWSDGHTTSIYRFRWLREACPCKECQTLQANLSPEKET